MTKYLKRLRHHPGVPVATALSLVFPLAGIANESTTVVQGIVIGLIPACLVWAIVLWTARTQPLADDDR